MIHTVQGGFRPSPLTSHFRLMTLDTLPSVPVYETLDQLLAAEAPVPADLDLDDEEEGGWDLFGWDGPDED